MSTDETIRQQLEAMDTLGGGIVYGKEEAWEKLQERMDGKPKRKIGLYYGMAAAVVLVMVCVWLAPSSSPLRAPSSSPQGGELSAGVAHRVAPSISPQGGGLSAGVAHRVAPSSSPQGGGLSAGVAHRIAPSSSPQGEGLPARVLVKRGVNKHKANQPPVPELIKCYDQPLLEPERSLASNNESGHTGLTAMERMALPEKTSMGVEKGRLAFKAMKVLTMSEIMAEEKTAADIPEIKRITRPHEGGAFPLVRSLFRQGEAGGAAGGGSLVHNPLNITIHLQH
ncbi:MAG: hypothetical protein V4649_03620 [Bacteroidota bacterium]